MSEKATQALMAKAAAAAGGPIICLVNNASVFERDSPVTATRESWDAHMQVNLRAPFALTQAFARQLPADAEGNVINLIDQRVWNVTPTFTSYTASKLALWGLTRNLALALAPRIRVNAIGPGPTLPSIHQSEAQFRREWSKLPLGRQVIPDEICRAVRFLLDTRSMTGQMIVLDGGQHLGWASGRTGRDAGE
jgi:NAD(P)-dependent dehydrogenase (short-subunit alcohol dehydrogenase family)